MWKPWTRKPKSALSGQGFSDLSTWPKAFFFGKVLAVGSILLGLLIWIFFISQENKSLMSKDVQTRIQYHPKFEPQEEEKKQIAHIVLIVGENEKLLAESIQKALSLEWCHVFRKSQHHIILSAQRRKPIFLIETAMGWKYVSENGQIYGQPLESETLPVLNGFLEKKELFPVLDNGILDVPKALTERFIQAKMILSEAEIPLSKIYFDQYLGFQVWIKDKNTKVDFGHPPFEEKIKKLHHALDHISQNHIQADTIELDFLGKTFIKEKKF